jgi:hypothetical protein
MTEALDFVGIVGFVGTGKTEAGIQPAVREAATPAGKIPPGSGAPYPEESLQILSISPPFRKGRHGRIMRGRRMMSLEQSILEAVRTLPPEKQRELLEHANRLREDDSPRKPFKTVRGLWADLSVKLTAEEIEDSRREMWKNFPRDF